MKKRGHPSVKYWKDKKFSEEHKDKIKKSLIGKKHSDVRKEKISKSLLGHSVSAETIKKIKIACSGEKHSQWKGGISKQFGYHSFLSNKRRIRKLGNGGSHTLGEWETLKAQYNFTCPACKLKEPEIKLTRDHIIPISKGGSDNIENIQPLCMHCNVVKHTKTQKYEIE